MCAATSEGHFYVGLEDASYDGTNTTFTYRVCGMPPTQNLSHWVLGLSPQCVAKIVVGSPAGVVTHPDPTTCLSGYKWDTSSGVASCTTTDCTTGSRFQVTFAGDVGLASTTVGNTITTKAGQLVETGCVDGPNATCTSNLPGCTTDAQCDDADACNGQETCVAGVCQPGMSLTCNDGSACNGQETCNPAIGCQPGDPLDCDDGDACNGEETCDAELGCRAGTPPDCDDGVLCTDDDCAPATGCTNVPIPGCCDADADCDDHSICTGTESCQLATGLCLPGVALACDDGDACNGEETCDAQLGCQDGAPPACDDGDVCNGVEGCDPGTGCTPGAPLVCDDGNPCTGEDACDSITGCFVETELDCDDGDPCTSDGCGASGCTNEPTDGCCRTDADCGDQDLCTTDACVRNVCTYDPAPASPTETACADMQDDDCDGPIDCDDPDCADVSPCPPIKKDPATIKFGPAGARLDVFKAHGRVEPGTALDVGGSEIGWMLSNGRGAVWRGALIPGDLATNASGTVFRYKDAGARLGNARRFGVYKAKIRIARDGTSYGFKVIAYGDLSAATDADMSLQFYMGDRNWAHNEPWARTSSGWKASGFE